MVFDRFLRCLFYGFVRGLFKVLSRAGSIVLIGFIIDSLMNTFYALIWPVFIVQWAMPLGAIALGVAFWLFPIYVKPHIEGWLFDGEPETEEEPEKAKEPESAAGP